MSKSTKNANSSKIKAPKVKQQTGSVNLFDILTQALSEFVHSEHIADQSYIDAIDQCIASKKVNPAAIEPVVYAFSPISNHNPVLLFKFIDLLCVRYVQNLAHSYTQQPTEFWHLHCFLLEQALENPEILKLLSSIAKSAAEIDAQNLSDLFMKEALPLYLAHIGDQNLTAKIITLVFDHTEYNESARDTRMSIILSQIKDEETKYLVASHSIMQERIFTARLSELYLEYVNRGLEVEEYQPYAVHILHHLARIKEDLLQEHISKITELVNDQRPKLQTAMIQLLIGANQETLLTQLINGTDNFEAISLSLHLITDLGSIPSQLLMMLFKKIGAQNIDMICNERCTIDSPVGPQTLPRLTSSWNSAAVNTAIITHIQSIALADWDVEYGLCKILLKQPMDSNSAQIWRHLFASLTPQFSELMREEDMTEAVFDIIGFYLEASQDISFFEMLMPALEPVVTVSKERCKQAGIHFLQSAAEIGPKFKQLSGTLIQV